MSRFVIEEGKGQIPCGTGLYVYNPDKEGACFYAVTIVVDGKELTSVNDENSLKTPVLETKGQGKPVLQSIEKKDSFQYIKNVTLYYYTRWETPPNASIKGMPMDYLVAVPPQQHNGAAPVGIHMHCWGGTLDGGYGWWNDAEDGALLLSTNQEPYDWWTGYHEKRFTGKPLVNMADWQGGVVRPYTTNRIISFLTWMKQESPFDVDLSRVFTAGSSMGGSGSLMMAIRFPELIAWSRSWVGVHNPLDSPNFKSSYEGVYGKQAYDVKFEDGTPVWDYYNDSWYLRQYPKKEIGFMTFSNGKNDSAIGWRQAIEFNQALQDTKRPYIFIWGQSGHSQRTIMPLTWSERVMPIDIRVDQSLPAFTRCSLDDNPGNGDPLDGDEKGQINACLYWKTEDIVDTVQRWELTVAIIDKAPEEFCLVDITPRRLQQFKPAPFENYLWENIDNATGKIIESGQVTADSNGIVTLPQVKVTKNTNRIVIRNVSSPLTASKLTPVF